MTSILKVDTIQDQAGNNIINESSDTITIGASGDTITILGTLQNGGTNFLQGITMADQWRVTALVTVSAYFNSTSGIVDYMGVGTLVTINNSSYSTVNQNYNNANVQTNMVVFL
jgi:hypothetical protein